MRVVLVEGEAGFEELAAGEVVLVFGAGDVGGGFILWIGQLRTERREEAVVVVNVVDEETAGENVAAGEVGLKFGEVAEAQDMVVVGADREADVDDVVVF